MQEVLKIVVPIIVVHLVVLTGVILVIKRLLWNDTMRAVEKINQVEAEVRKKEEAIRREIEEHERDFARRRNEAEQDLQKHKEQSEKELNQLREKLVGEAKAEGEHILEHARRSEEKFRQQVLQEIEQKAVEYGAQIFELVFSEKMSEELNRHFVAELFDALEAIDSSGITVDAGTAEFTAGYPMDRQQKERLGRILADKFGVNVAIEEKIEKNLLAGIVFKLGSLEIDGSLRNRFREAAAEVKKSAGF
jgi:F0F1-type ATP synthase membrane subunit b/b'